MKFEDHKKEVSEKEQEVEPPKRWHYTDSRML
jgi:hypothetical protein